MTKRRYAGSPPEHVKRFLKEVASQKQEKCGGEPEISVIMTPIDESRNNLLGGDQVKKILLRIAKLEREIQDCDKQIDLEYSKVPYSDTVINKLNEKKVELRDKTKQANADLTEIRKKADDLVGIGKKTKESTVV